jgi:hypothetical protein
MLLLQEANRKIAYPNQEYEKETRWIIAANLLKNTSQKNNDGFNQFNSIKTLAVKKQKYRFITIFQYRTY